jgi:hypothetical protein
MPMLMLLLPLTMIIMIRMKMVTMILQMPMIFYSRAGIQVKAAPTCM